tara:strand:+ start:3913 stop:5001 length:1089 start_codon:yes stop_codon:yes gene_type:complete
MARDYSSNKYKDKVKKIQQQKRTAALKRKSVADLKREVKSNKKIESANRTKKANKEFGERVNAILDLFKPKKKARPGVRSGIQTGKPPVGRGKFGSSTTSSAKLTSKAGRDPAKTLTNAQRASMARIGSVSDTIPMDLTGTARRKKLSKLAETRAMAEARISGGKSKRRPPQGGSGGPSASTDRAGPKGYRKRKDRPAYGGYVLDSTKPKRRPPQSGSGGPSSNKRPPQSGSGPKAKPKELPTGVGGDKALPRLKSYTIKKGDTLTAIAKANGTTVAMLKKANNIKDADKIRTGQKIKIYKDKDWMKKEVKPFLADRPRTIAQAQKMGKKYFYDKNGKRKAAVTAEQLKKSGLTLSQWLKKK